MLKGRCYRLKVRPAENNFELFLKFQLIDFFSTSLRLLPFTITTFNNGQTSSS
jgi:hypothetical protein